MGAGNEIRSQRALTLAEHGILRTCRGWRILGAAALGFTHLAARMRYTGIRGGIAWRLEMGAVLYEIVGVTLLFVGLTGFILCLVMLIMLSRE